MLRRFVEIFFGLFFCAEVLFVGTSFFVAYGLVERPPGLPFPYSAGLFAVLAGRVVLLVFLGCLVAYLFFRRSRALRWALPLYVGWATVVLVLWSLTPDNPEFIQFTDDLATRYSEGTLDETQWRVPDSVVTYPMVPTYAIWVASLIYVFVSRSNTTSDTGAVHS